MKIRRLTLENFGIYAYSNTLDLQSNKPIILIGGMNGRGKTTILEAILLALYGRRSFAAEESSLPFPKYLANFVNKTDGTLVTKLELEFEVQSEGEHIVYTVTREWSQRTAIPALKTQVQKNGTEDQLLSENWDLFVEEMLPSALAPFFFFDGEKIAKLADADNDAQIKKSVKALLGIHVIDQAVSDLERIISSKKKLVKSSAFEQEFTSYETKHEEIEAKIEISKRRRVTLEAESIQLESEKNQAEKIFETMGGNLAKNRKDLLAKQGALLERLEKTNSRMMELVAGDLPLLLTLPLLKKIASDAGKEREQQGIRTALEQLPALFQEYERGKQTGLEIDDFINYVKGIVVEDKVPTYSLPESAYYQLQMLCATLPEQQRGEAMELLAARKETQAELADAENYLSIRIDETETGKQHQTILRLAAELATVKEQLRIAVAAEKADQAIYDELVRNHQKLIEKAVSSIEDADDTKRIIRYSGLTIQVLQEYRVRLQAAKTKHLASTMTDCFKRLVSKKNLISEIQIDKLTLDFHYLSGNGTEISPASLSAGERQLLVIAMLWALGICSKKQFPIIIDTPLARLDNIHRKALISNYFPCASEQTILLSTDSEIYGQHYEMLKPYVEKQYSLIYDESTKRSVIEEGYLGGGTK